MQRAQLYTLPEGLGLCLLQDLGMAEEKVANIHSCDGKCCSQKAASIVLEQCGINNMCQIVISDIVTLQDRGKYQGIIGGVLTLGYAISPVIGSVLAQKLHLSGASGFIFQYHCVHWPPLS
ncbi:hypothetical protein BYT27DRAFT_7210019 [Phlegmacium glaucopus]|nr:hypothetical protein BYT27DRAFT_7210019 [Phlegmacium glaucopus]